MANTKEISELENYENVLIEVAKGNPVYLTENGKCKYVILDLQEYEDMKEQIERFNKM